MFKLYFDIPRISTEIIFKIFEKFKNSVYQFLKNPHKKETVYLIDYLIPFIICVTKTWKRDSG